MITASWGVGPFRSSAEVPVATPLPSLQGRQLPTALARPFDGEAMPVEIIDISDDEEEIDWDLLRGESEQASLEMMAKRRLGRRERRPHR